jgi:predicted amidophosphoribosyltransferase
MLCEECMCAMDFDDEIWSWVCPNCGEEIEQEGEPPQLDLSEDDEEENELF